MKAFLPMVVWLTCASLLSGCEAQITQETPPSDAVRFPTSLALDSDGKHLYVVNSHFDVAHDLAAFVVVDLETGELLPQSAVGLGSFPGVLVLRSDAEGATQGYVPDRATGALNWFDIQRDADGHPLLDCGGLGNESMDICSGAHAIRTATLDGEVLTPGVEPFGCGLRTGRDGAPDLLFTGALQDGTLGVWELSDEGTPALADHRTLAAGLYGIATSALTGVTFIATKLTQTIFAAVTTPVLLPTGPATGETLQGAPSPLVQITGLGVTSPLQGGGSFGQALATSTDGDLLYVVSRSPSSVLVLRAVPSAQGALSPELIGFVEVGAGTAELAVSPRADGLGDRVYAVSYSTGDVYVIDTLFMEVVDIFHVGTGPYDIAIHASESGSRAYISLFEEDAIAVVDLDEQSPTYHQVIERFAP